MLRARVLRSVVTGRWRLAQLTHLRLDAEREGGRMIEAHILRLVGARRWSVVRFVGGGFVAERVSGRMIETDGFWFVCAGS